MIAHERRPASSLAGRAGAGVGAAGSSVARRGAESVRLAGTIFSIVFHIEGWTRVTALIMQSATPWKVTFNLNKNRFYI
jgi:hypothetical protein